MRPDASNEECSAVVATRVAAARQLQLARSGMCNAELAGASLKDAFITENGVWPLLEKAMDSLALSARACQRVQRVARTIADLADNDSISKAHVAEALALRQFDRDAADQARLLTL